MDLKKMGTDMLTSKLGGNVDAGAAKAALDKLLAGAGGGVSGLVKKFEGGGLAEITKSWLGDGANKPVTPDQVTSALGSDQVADFAKNLGIDKAQAAEKLSHLLPELVDKSSRGGKLLDVAGAAKGLAGKLFK